MDRFRAAAGAGFAAVECLFPYDHPAETVARELEACGLEMVLINAPPGDWRQGERGLAAVPGREDAFRGAIERAVAYAGTIDCRRIHVMAGIVAEDAERREYDEAYLANLGHAAGACGAAGITALIEPINPIDMPGYYLSDPVRAVDTINEIASPFLGLQLDLYHVAMLGRDPADMIRMAGSAMRHVQIAGHPGRAEPAGGSLDYPALFRLLDASGYDGWVGCEYRPRTSTVAGLGWAREFGLGG